MNDTIWALWFGFAGAIGMLIGLIQIGAIK